MNQALKDATESLVKIYGPFAFGVVSLLVMWVAIIAPELDRNAVDGEVQRELMFQQVQVTERMEDTATILDRVSKRLEEMEKQPR